MERLPKHLQTILCVVSISCILASALLAGQAQRQTTNAPSSIPLRDLVVLNRVSDLEAALKAGREVGGRDAVDRTPLHYAAALGNAKAVRVLLDAGAKVSATDSAGVTPLHLAAGSIRGNPAQVGKLLLDAEADVNATDKTDERALHSAASGGTLTVVKELLKAGAEVAARDEDGKTPLSNAVDEGRTRIVRTLFKHASDVNLDSLLLSAARQGYVEMAEMLLQAGASPHPGDELPRTSPLHVAAMKNHPAVCLLLVQHGAKVNVKEEYSVETSQVECTPMQRAAFGRSADAARVLAEKGADIGVFGAVLLSDIQRLRTILDRAPDRLTARLETGMRVRLGRYTVSLGRTRALKVLLDYARKEGLKRKELLGKDILRKAITSGSLKTVRTLVEDGVDVPAEMNVTGNGDIFDYLRSNGTSIPEGMDDFADLLRRGVTPARRGNWMEAEEMILELFARRPIKNWDRFWKKRPDVVAGIAGTGATRGSQPPRPAAHPDRR